MKWLVIGHGRHGKDTAAEIMQRDYGTTFQSSSMACAELLMFPIMQQLGFPYKDFDECFDDRHNHRALWFNTIKAKGHMHPGWLVEQILNESDMYVGMRARSEYEATKHMFDHIIWIENERLTKEPKNSMELSGEDAHWVVYNNSSIPELAYRIRSLMEHIYEVEDSE